MNALVEFLWARYDDDEHAARRAAELCGCHPPAPSWTFNDGDGPSDGRILIADDPHPRATRKLSRRWNNSYEGLFAAEHIVRHDPARVLADVVAKRMVLADHATPHTVVDGFCVEDGGECTHAGENYCSWHNAFDCATLKALALPYVDHPDYDETWRP